MIFKTYTAEAEKLKEREANIAGDKVIFDDGDTMPLENFVRLGDFWLECAAPAGTKKSKSKPEKHSTLFERKSRKMKPEAVIIDGETYGNAAYCDPVLPNFSQDIVYSWRDQHLIRAKRLKHWFFCVKDLVRIGRLRDPIGRVVGTAQYYTPKEIARRTRMSVGAVTGWGTRECVDVHHPLGSVAALCWVDVKAYCKMRGIEIK